MRKKHLRALTGVILSMVLALTPAGSAVVPVFGAEAADEVLEAEPGKDRISENEVSEETIVSEDTARAEEPAASADEVEEEADAVKEEADEAEENAGDIEYVDAVWNDYDCLLDKTNKRLTLIEYTGSPVTSLTVPASANGVKIKNEGGSETQFDQQCTVCVGAPENCDQYFVRSVWSGTQNTLESLTLENGVQCNQSLRYLFSGLSHMTSLSLNSLDTLNVTDMGYMFDGCQCLSSLDVSRFNTSNVKKMNSMFQYCSNLAGLDVSKFDTSKVTDMGFMFYGCQSLSCLNVSGFNTSNVTDMGYMFSSCGILTGLDVSHFDTSKVTDMRSMFQDCLKLSSLNISHYDTSNVTDMSAMFSDCQSLSSLNVSGFDTSNVTDMGSMFSGCWILTGLDVSHYDTSNVTDMSAMFSGCQSLSSLDVSGFNTSNVTDMRQMFSYCRKLTNLDLSGFDTSGVSSFDCMFSNCTGLEKIEGDLANFSGDSAKPDTGLGSIFFKCELINSINLAGFTAFNSNALKDCTSINRVVFPDKLTTLSTGETPLQGTFYMPLTLDTVTFGSKLGDADLHVYGPAAIQSTVEALNNDGEKGTGTAYFHELSTESADYPYRDKVYATGLKISQTEATIKYNPVQKKGTSVTLTADILPAEASNRNVRWSVEEAYEYCLRVVRYDASLGKAKFVARDLPYSDITVTATSGDGKVNATCVIHITETYDDIPDEPEDVKVTGVTLDRHTAEVAVNNSIKLNATVAPADAADKKVTWSNSDNSVATVDPDGNVTGKKTGFTTITVTTKDGKKTDKCLVTVINVPLLKISLPDSVTVEKGKNATIPVTFTPSNASNKNLTWTVSDPSIATVSNGTVTGLAVGTTVVTARSEEGSHAASCSITVKEPEPQPRPGSFVVTFMNEGEVFDTVKVDEGKTVQEPSGIPKSKTEGNEFVGWTYEGKLYSFATPVRRDITLEAKYVSKAPEAVSQNTGSGMDPVPQIENSTIYLVKGQVYTAGGSGWKVKSGSGITVAAKTGKITAKKKGHCTVANDSMEYLVAVAEPSIANSDRKVSLVIGDTKSIAFEINPADKDEENKYSVTWGTDNPAIATVDNGLITGIGKGRTKVYACVGGRSYVSTVTVTDTYKAPGKAKSADDLIITMNPLQTMIIKYDAKVFKVNGASWQDEKGAMEPTTNRSGRPDGGYGNDVVKIAKNGKITAIGAGKTTITGTQKDDASKKVKVIITVKDATERTIAYVTKGKKKAIRIPFVVNKRALWDSSDRTVISEFRNGAVKGGAVGSSEITCSYNGFLFKILTYVEDPEFDTEASGGKIVKNGNKYEMKLKVGDVVNRVSMKNVSRSVSFKNSKPAVAFIDENGVVYARSKGKTNITTNINGKSYKLAVTVGE